MEQPVYGRVHHIQIDGVLYQIQSIDEPFNTSFTIKRSGELLCTVSMNDENEWVTDPEIDEEKLTAIIQWIKRLYK